MRYIVIIASTKIESMTMYSVLITKDPVVLNGSKVRGSSKYIFYSLFIWFAKLCLRTITWLVILTTASITIRRRRIISAVSMIFM